MKPVTIQLYSAAVEDEDPACQLTFLFAPSLPDAIYYRWRVYSLANGDTKRRWRVRPFQM
jgi:U2-associated protein SR140